MISARTDYGILRTTGGYTFRETNEGSVRAGLHSNATNDLILKAGSASEKMRITANGGKIGIGETSPLVKLHVKVADSGAAAYAHCAAVFEDSDHTFIDIMSGTTSSGGINFGDSGGSQRGVLEYDHSSDFMRIITASGERVRIDSSGRLLVNTTTEGHVSADDLTVAGSGDTGITIRSGTGSEGSIMFSDGTSGDDEYRGWINYNQSSNFLRFFTNAAERVRIDSSGRLLVGHISSRAVGDRTHLIQIEGTELQDGGLSMVRNRNDEHSTSITLAKTRGSADGAVTIVQSGDSIGEFAFAAADGTDVVTRAARIHCEIDGTPGANDMPGRLILSTTADGAASPTERMRIDSAGKLLVGQTSDSDGQLCMAGVLAFSAGGSGTASGSNARPNISRGADGQLLLAAGKDSGSSIRFDVATNASTNAAERMRLDSGGRLRLGSSSLLTGFAGANVPKLQVSSITTGEWAGITSASYTSDTAGGRIILAKSRSGTINSHTVVNNGDQVGLITYEASDGTDFHRVAQIEARVNGTVGNNIIPGLLEFSVARSNAGSPTAQMTLNGAATKLSLNNDTFLEIPHDERCIVFDEGQKMITSNDGQGNFNIIAGKNHEAVHVGSASGNSGIVQLELNSDGANGNLAIGVGPIRASGQSALFTNGLVLTQATSGLNNFNYVTGASIASPSGLGVSSGQKYAILNRGNCHDGSWNTENTAQFKVLGDGGSAALTTNDGGGNSNVCFNHASETPDTNGSSWRITVGVDSSNASMHFMSNGNTTNGQTAGVTSRLEITHSGTFVGSSTNNISDVRLKKNIGTITDATTKIKGLIGRTFEWKDEADLDTGTQYGFIAQEMETVVSDLVSDGTSFGLRAFDKDGNLVDNINHDGQKEKIVEYSKGVNMTGVVPILVEALKEAIGKIETLETKVAALEAA